VLLRAMNAAFGKGGTRGGGEGAVEKPMEDEAGSNGLEMEMAPGSQYANDLFRTGGVGGGTGASVGVGASVDAVMFGTAHGVTISCCVVPSKG
jgi:hypothetical protein